MHRPATRVLRARTLWACVLRAWALRARALWACALALPIVAGCTREAAPPTSVPNAPATPKPTPTAVFTPTRFDALPGWSSDDLAAALVAFRTGCTAMTDDRVLGGQGEAAQRGGAGRDWRAACAVARTVHAGDADARRFFETAFEPVAITASDAGPGLFTGYYEPELHGARVRSARDSVPLYARPPDLIEADLGAFSSDLKGRTLVGRIDGDHYVPYADRAAITDGALAGRGLELLWVTDAIDAFFLEIQGSGRVTLDGGGVARVTYAGQNGRPYVAIGRVLIDRGDLTRDNVSLQSIRAWLLAHPDQTRAVLDQNPSYVFFRELKGAQADQGPPGALGAPLTPGRSLAVDRAYVPLGTPVWIETLDPLDGSPIRRLMLAQDTGGAIKGAVRGDLFWGWGADAEARAGKMKSPGAAVLLLPRQH